MYRIIFGSRGSGGELTIRIAYPIYQVPQQTFGGMLRKLLCAEKYMNDRCI